MKERLLKVAVLFTISLLFLACTLCACTLDLTSPNAFNITKGAPSEEFISSEDVKLTVDSEDYKKLTVINNSQTEIVIGVDARLQVFSEGKWYELITDCIYPAVGYNVVPGDTREMEIDFKAQYVTPSGMELPHNHYRIVYPYLEDYGTDAYGRSMYSKTKYMITEFDV